MRFIGSIITWVSRPTEAGWFNNIDTSLTWGSSCVAGEEMIRAIYHLRFANSFTEPLLNREHVESISVGELTDGVG